MNTIKSLAFITALVPALALAAPKATVTQKSVAYYLKDLAGQKGGALNGVIKGSIRANDIKISGKAGGIKAPDHGGTVGFSTLVERRIASTDLPRSFELMKVTGKFISNSFGGPYVQIQKVTPWQAPRVALER
jgi:hypothetical protein